MSPLLLTTPFIFAWCLSSTEAIPCESGKRYSHPSNCSVYIACDVNSNPNTLYCPDGLHFNAKKSECDSPANANCMLEEETSSTNGEKEKVINLSEGISIVEQLHGGDENMKNPPGYKDEAQQTEESEGASVVKSDEVDEHQSKKDDMFGEVSVIEIKSITSEEKEKAINLSEGISIVEQLHGRDENIKVPPGYKDEASQTEELEDGGVQSKKDDSVAEVSDIEGKDITVIIDPTVEEADEDVSKREEKNENEEGAAGDVTSDAPVSEDSHKDSIENREEDIKENNSGSENLGMSEPRENTKLDDNGNDEFNDTASEEEVDQSVFLEVKNVSLDNALPSKEIGVEVQNKSLTNYVLDTNYTEAVSVSEVVAGATNNKINGSSVVYVDVVLNSAKEDLGYDLTLPVSDDVTSASSATNTSDHSVVEEQAKERVSRDSASCPTGRCG